VGQTIAVRGLPYIEIHPRRRQNSLGHAPGKPASIVIPEGLAAALRDQAVLYSEETLWQI
jgi:hypothetical protein